MWLHGFRQKKKCGYMGRGIRSPFLFPMGFHLQEGQRFLDACVLGFLKLYMYKPGQDKGDSQQKKKKTRVRHEVRSTHHGLSREVSIWHRIPRPHTTTRSTTTAEVRNTLMGSRNASQLARRFFHPPWASLCNVAQTSVEFNTNMMAPSALGRQARAASWQ